VRITGDRQEGKIGGDGNYQRLPSIKLLFTPGFNRVIRVSLILLIFNSLSIVTGLKPRCE